MDTALRTSALLLVLTSLIPTGPAWAEHSPEDASVGLYLIEGNRLRCDDIDPPDCEDGPLVAGELFTGYYAVLCVFNGDAEKGIAGLQCALDYNGTTGSGVEIDQWTYCASLQFPLDGWPAPGGEHGIRITWDPDNECQKNEPGGVGEGVTAVAGFFYVNAYSPDRMSVIEWSYGSTRGLQIAYCVGPQATIPLDRAGSLGFSDDGTEEGSLPCHATPREETTWGQIKSFYDNR